jgi:cell division protein FtsQ
MNSQARLARVTRNAYSSVTPSRPVTVRGATLGTTLLRQNPTIPRKRVYIPLSHSGAEVRLPSIPVIRPGWRLLSFVITALSLAAIISAFTVPSLQIEGIQVSGIKRIKTADIEAVLDLENLSIVQVDIKEVEQKLLEKFPELIQTQVLVNFPAKVSITSIERQPVLAWRTDKSTVWIDQEGYIIPERGEVEGLISIQSREAPPLLADKKASQETNSEKETQGKPLSNPGPGQISPSIVSAAKILKSKLPSETQILYNHPSGLGWVDPRGWSVLFGMNMENIETRMNIYLSLANQIEKKGIKPSMISVEFIDAPYYRTER